MLRTDLIAPIPELLRRHAAARGEQMRFSRRAFVRHLCRALTSRTGKLAGQLADSRRRAERHSGDHPAEFGAMGRKPALAIARAGADRRADQLRRDRSRNRLPAQGRRIARAIITTAERGDLLAQLQASAPNSRPTDRDGSRKLQRDGVALRRSDRRAAADRRRAIPLAARNRLHSLHLGHHRPRQGRSAHGARHVVGRRPPAGRRSPA